MDLLPTFNSILLLATFAINLGLGLFLFFKRRHSAGHGSFCALIFLLALLSLCIFFAWNTSSQAALLFWIRSAYFFAAFLPSVLVYFSLVFPRGLSIPNSLQKVAIFLPALIFAGLAYTPLLEEKVGYPFPILPKYGPGMIFFNIFLASFLLFAFIVLIRKYFAYEGRERLQIWYVLFGLIVTS